MPSCHCRRLGSQAAASNTREARSSTVTSSSTGFSPTGTYDTWTSASGHSYNGVSYGWGDTWFAVDSTTGQAGAVDPLGINLSEDALWWETSQYGARRQALPVTVSCPTVTRGDNVTCTVSAPAGYSFTLKGWTFEDADGNVVSNSATATTWSGIAVTSGTVTVSISHGRSTNFPSALLTVNPRDWHTPPPSPISVPNGTLVVNGQAITLPVPPTPIGNDSNTGVSGYEIGDSGFDSDALVAAGPNKGYGYYVSSPDFASVTFFKYTINPDLSNSSSTFSSAQCGNYDALSNPSGFISWKNLLTQTERHEYNSSSQSHYAFFVNAMDKKENNPGDYFEARVRPPLVLNLNFDRDTRNGLDKIYSLIKQDTDGAGEPYPVNASETNTFLGNINYLPYVNCP